MSPKLPSRSPHSPTASTSAPTIRVPSTSPPLSPPSKLAVRYRPTPLPSPQSTSTETVPLSFASTSTSDASSSHQGRPASPIDTAAEDTTPVTSAATAPSSLPAITTAIRASLSKTHRADSYTSQLSTSSSFSSGGSPIVPSDSANRFTYVPAPTPPTQLPQPMLERPNIQQRQRSYSNRMAEDALVALENLMRVQREKEGEGEKEVERRRRGMGGEGVKSVWREVGVWQ